jgi:hypothetical protein
VRCKGRQTIRRPDTHIAAKRASTEVNMSTRIIAATAAAVLLAMSSPAFAGSHAARHHREQQRFYSEPSRYYDVVPGPNIVLPNFGPTSGEDFSSVPFPSPQGHGR